MLVLILLTVLISSNKVTGEGILNNEYNVTVLQNGLNGYSGIQDTYIYPSGADVNINSALADNFYFASYNGRILMKIDLSGIPKNAYIKNATLMIYPYSQYSEINSPPQELQLNELLVDWDVGNTNGPIDSPEKHGATWNKRFDYFDNSKDVLWNLPGADGQGTDYAYNYAAKGYNSRVRTWTMFDITDYVKRKVNFEEPDNGFIIISNSGSPETIFASSEYAQQDLRPKIVIELDTKTPLANAGDDVNKIDWKPGQAVHLDATSSYDSAQVGDTQKALNYTWHFTKIAYGSNIQDSDITPNSVSGATCITASTGTFCGDTPSFIPDKAGNYEIELTVTNSQRHSNTDTVKVQVLNIPQEHPRIFLTKERLANVQKHKAENTVLWKDFESNVNYRQDVSMWGGLGYQILGNSNYCRTLIDNQIAALESYAKRDCQDFNVQCADQLKDLAIVYDWCYDIATTEEKNLMLESINSMAQRTGKAISGFHNYAQNNMLAVAYAGIATAYESVNASNWLDNALNYRYDEALLPLLNLAGPGGGWPEGTNYASFTKLFAAEFAEALYSGAGVDIYSSNPYYHDEIAFELTMDYPVYALDPWYGDFRDYPSIGDGERQRAVFSDYYRLARTIISAHYNDDLAKQLRYYLTKNDNARLNKPVFERYTLPEELIFTDPDAETTPPTTLINYANGTGQIFIKSDETENATYVSFQAGDHFKYHQHLDQGGFTIFKYSDLALDSGNYQGAGNRGAQEVDYMMKTVAHNSLLIYDPNEQQRLRSGLWTQNDGGQRAFAGGVDVVDIAYWDKYDYNTADIVKFQDTNNFVYADANLTNGYTGPSNKPIERAGAIEGGNPNSQKANLVEREFVYLKPKTANGNDAVITFDRVNSTNKDFKKSNLVHFLYTPQVTGTATKINDEVIEYDGDTTVAENENSKIFVKTLLPLDNKISRVGSYAKINITRNYHAGDSIMYLSDTSKLPDSGYIFIAGAYVPWPTYEDQEWLNYSGKTADSITNVKSLNWYQGNPSNHSAGGWASAYETSGFYVYGEVYDSNGVKQGTMGVNYLPWDIIEANPTYGAPRIEVSPLYNETYDNFLNVLYPTSSSTAEMPETTLIKSANENMYGALFDNRLVMFAKNPEVIKQTQYTLPDTGEKDNYIFDLQPSSFYIIDIDGVKQELVTSNEGTLNFATKHSTVTLTLKGVASCSDGTLYSSCSSNRPYYCDNGNLIKKSSICGCTLGKSSADDCTIECSSASDCDDKNADTTDRCVSGVCKHTDIYKGPYCGDGTCNNAETCTSCSSDCGECPKAVETCGNGNCASTENCSSCSADCNSCPFPAVNCTDSDSGLDYSIKATATNSSVNGTDECNLSILTEYYCDSSSVFNLKYPCTYGCSDGACKSAPVTPSPTNTGGSSGSSGGGGGGGGIFVKTGNTYSISTEQLSSGYAKSLSQADKVSFNIQQQAHSVAITSITADSAMVVISSAPQTITLLKGQERKVELTGDDFYDLSVTLNDITGLLSKQADITIKTIHEQVTSTSEEDEQEKQQEAVQQVEKAKVNVSKQIDYAILTGIIISIIIVLIIVGRLINKRRNLKHFKEKIVRNNEIYYTPTLVSGR